MRTRSRRERPRLQQWSPRPCMTRRNLCTHRSRWIAGSSSSIGAGCGRAAALGLAVSRPGTMTSTQHGVARWPQATSPHQPRLAATRHSHSPAAPTRCHHACVNRDRAHGSGVPACEGRGSGTPRGRSVMEALMEGPCTVRLRVNVAGNTNSRSSCYPATGPGHPHSPHCAHQVHAHSAALRSVYASHASLRRWWTDRPMLACPGPMRRCGSISHSVAGVVIARRDGAASAHWRW